MPRWRLPDPRGAEHRGVQGHVQTVGRICGSPSRPREAGGLRQVPNADDLGAEKNAVVVDLLDGVVGEGPLVDPALPVIRQQIDLDDEGS